MEIQEQACWLTLVFKSGLSGRMIHEIIALWCVEQGRTLQEFFSAEPSLWRDICALDEKTETLLLRVRERIAEQMIVAREMKLDAITMLRVIDESYPGALRSALQPQQMPPLLFCMGDRQLLTRRTVAIVGSRHAQEESIAFAYHAAAHLAQQGVNIISGFARGVDRAAYDGALSAGGYTTIVLPSGISTLSDVQMQLLLPLIEVGRVLLLSQFHPTAPWMVSRAMARNKVLTGLASAVLVAEANTQGGTWDAARGALEQHKPLYVYQSESGAMLPGNQALLELGGQGVSSLLGGRTPARGMPIAGVLPPKVSNLFY